MARLVLGTDINNTGTASFVRDVSPAHYIEKTVDANGKLVNGSATVIDLTGITDIGNFALSYAYTQDLQITTVDMSGVTTISGGEACAHMFEYCSSITSVDLSSLRTISGAYGCANMVSNCIRLTSYDMSALEEISGNSGCSNMFRSTPVTVANFPSLRRIGQNGCSNMFSYSNYLTTISLPVLETLTGSGPCNGMFRSCSQITTVDLPSLKTMNGTGIIANMFSDCSSLTRVTINALDTIVGQFAAGTYAGPFSNCKKLEYLSFGGLKSSTFASAVNQMQYLFDSNTGSQAPSGCTVHFPSNFDPSDPNHTFDASTLSGYPTFGGNANYIHVAFDLPATE